MRGLPAALLGVGSVHAVMGPRGGAVAGSGSGRVSTRRQTKAATASAEAAADAGAAAARDQPAAAGPAPAAPGALAKRTLTLAGLEHDLQQVVSRMDSMCSTVGTLSEQVPYLQQQLSQLSASMQQQQQSADGALPSWQGNMLAATQQVEDLNTAFASLKQQLTDASSTFNAGLACIQEQQQQLDRRLQEEQEQLQLLQQLVEQQLQAQREEQQRLLQKQQEQQQMLTQVQEQLQQHQQQQQPQPARFMVHAPVGTGGADLVATLVECGGVTPSSITSARIVWSPKPAAAEGNETLAAAGGGSGGSSSGSASGARRSMCLWEVTLKEADLLSNMLGGRIRSNLRQAGHSIYVDAMLSAEERQQRKAMQQLRRELQQQGVRTRWSRATLMRWRRGGADGRRGSWEEVPPLPAEVPGS